MYRRAHRRRPRRRKICSPIRAIPYTRGPHQLAAARVDRQASALTPVDGSLPSPFDLAARLPVRAPLRRRVRSVAGKRRRASRRCRPGPSRFLPSFSESGAMRPEDASEQAPFWSFATWCAITGRGDGGSCETSRVVHAVDGVKPRHPNAARPWASSAKAAAARARLPVWPWASIRRRTARYCSGAAASPACQPRNGVGCAGRCR